MPLIQASKLSKSFGDTLAVDNLSLQVRAGEIYGLVGPDGAGKTTTMRLLCNALKPTSGSATIAGYDLSRQTERAREQIGYLPQRFSLYEELSVIENIRFFAEVRGIPPGEWEPRCQQILKFVGLAEFSNRWAGNLSGGMRQKLGLAAALVHQPRVLLLDEPTTGVDPITRQDFWQLIINLIITREVAVLVSTPYMDEATRCTRLGFMRAGRLLAEGSASELREPLQNRIIELRGTPLPLLRKLAGADREVEDVQMFGDRLHLRVHEESARNVISRLKRRIPAEGGEISLLNSIPPQLEDVFIALLEPEPKL